MKISVLGDSSSEAGASNPISIQQFSDPKVRQLIQQAFVYFRNIDERKIFGKPVTDNEAPNYSKVIKRPMDLLTISNKLDFYTSVENIKDDIDLILENCRIYNSSNDFYLKVCLFIFPFSNLIEFYAFNLDYTFQYHRKLKRLWDPKIRSILDIEQELLISGHDKIISPQPRSSKTKYYARAVLSDDDDEDEVELDDYDDEDDMDMVPSVPDDDEEDEEWNGSDDSDDEVPII